MGPGRSALAPLVFSVGAVSDAVGWRSVGALPTAANFSIYAGRFWFDAARSPGLESGRLEIVTASRLEGHPAEQGVGIGNQSSCSGGCEAQGVFLFAFEVHDHWLSIRDRVPISNCEEQLKDAAYVLDVTPSGGHFNQTVHLKERVRPRLWFFAFSACGSSDFEPTAYFIHAMASDALQAENTRGGVSSELGLDEEGVLELQTLAAFLFIGLAVFSRCTAGRRRDVLHSRPLLRLLIASSTLSAAGCSWLALHYAVYALVGDGMPSLEVLGSIAACLARVSFTVLLLLLSRGWALPYVPAHPACRSSMPSRTRVAVGLLASAVALAFVCEVRARYFCDEIATLYPYQSTPGACTLWLSVVLFLEAWRSMWRTYRSEVSYDARVLRAVVAVSDLLHFLSVPAACLFAPGLSPWLRSSWTTRAEVGSRLATAALLAPCLRPSRFDALTAALREEGLEKLSADLAKEAGGRRCTPPPAPRSALPGDGAEESERLLQNDRDGDECLE